jgi:uncharacterized membrane protein YozB (DUF420 family)
MALFTAPLAAATMRALDDEDQGIASGVNNAMGQLAGLLAIIVLPALAGLAGASSLGGAVLAEAYPRALRAAAVLAVVGIPVALLTLPGARSCPPTRHRRRRLSTVIRWIRAMPGGWERCCR